MDRVLLMLRALADQLDRVEEHVVAHGVATVLQHVVDSVDVPSPVRTVLVGGDHHVAAALRLELRLCCLEEHQQLLHHRLDVGAIDQRKAKLHGTFLDRNIGVFEALKNGGAVSLDRSSLHTDRLQEGVESHVADVLVVVEQEPPEDVHRQHSEP